MTTYANPQTEQVAPLLDPAKARSTWFGLGYGSHVLYGLGVNGGTRTLGSVDDMWAVGLEKQGLLVANSDGTYTLTPNGWECFYAGTSFARWYYGPGVVCGPKPTENL